MKNVFVLLLIAGLFVAGCSFGGVSPEKQLKTVVARCEKSHGLAADEVAAMKAKVNQMADSLQKADANAYQKLLPAIEQAQVWLRHAEVLVVHDHCMPQMGRMADLKQQLESLGSLSASAADSAKAAATALTAADEAMMAWMHKFRADVPRQQIQHSTAMQYLNEQHAIISRVDSQIFASMEAATLLLQRHAQPK